VADSQPGLTATNDDHVNPLAQVEPRRPDTYPTGCLLKTNANHARRRPNAFQEAKEPTASLQAGRTCALTHLGAHERPLRDRFPEQLKWRRDECVRGHRQAMHEVPRP